MPATTTKRAFTAPLAVLTRAGWPGVMLVTADCSKICPPCMRMASASPSAKLRGWI
ncbi:hypothetical protein D3C75_1159930 [compost metagenome]